MQNCEVYEQISSRTAGDIYIGVVGPVRTGKSTFIKRFMELMVLPQITDIYKRERAIDELPQFWNVLKGDMSLVGTRPPTVDEFEQYDVHHKARLGYKPGITGLWQVSGRSKITDFEQVVELDKKYIQEWSLGLDIKILLRTVGAVLRKDGSM